MTPKEFHARMSEIVETADGDWESSHEQGDALMCELLRSLGYGDGVDVFLASTRDYS